MSKAVLWHNPRCSKSRQSLQLLEKSGSEVEVVKYLEDTPSREELEHVLTLLEMDPRDLMRKQEQPYKELNLADPEKTRDELIDAMLLHPVLIERPIFVYEGRAIIGRPPENVLTLLK